MTAVAPGMARSRPGRAAGTAGELLAAARGVHVRAGGRDLLVAVDLAVHAGEIVAVIGPNGAGKTTLLRALLGLVPLAGGEVWLKPGIGVGYMPQRLAVDPALPLTVRRFLALGQASSAHARAQALDEVGAAGLLDSPIQDISGGELQRVLLARALLREPDLLVLDEPVQSVDVGGQRELHALIGRIRERRGCGVLIVSHDLHLVMAATDTVLCLNHHVCCTGRPEAVSRDPAYLALFGPDIADGFALYTHHHDHAHDPAGTVVPLEEQADEAEGEAEARHG